MIAAQRGIEVGVPPESDLFRPRFLYGVDEITHSHIKLRARRHELMARQQDAANRLAAATQEQAFINGALDDLNYMFQTWPDKRKFDGPPVISEPVLVGHAPELGSPVVPVVMPVRRRGKAKPKTNGSSGHPVSDAEVATIHLQAELRDMHQVQ